MASLDRIDFEILQILRDDARISNKDLAGRVGLASSSCLTRVRALVAEGVIKGYYADLDLRQLGVGLRAMVTVKLAKHSRNEFEEFRQHLMAQPEVERVVHLSGANDFMVQVATRDTDHLRDLVLEAFTERKEVSHIETSLIYDEWTNTQLDVSRGNAQ